MFRMPDFLLFLNVFIIGSCAFLKVSLLFFWGGGGGVGRHRLVVYKSTEPMTAQTVNMFRKEPVK